MLPVPRGRRRGFIFVQRWGQALKSWMNPMRPVFDGLAAPSTNPLIPVALRERTGISDVSCGDSRILGNERKKQREKRQNDDS